MNKILPRGGLLDFNLCYVDPDEEKRQILRRLSDATGRIVLESDPAAQIALAVLPSIVQARAGADAAAKTSLLSYATGAALDRLGACVGCVRFPVGPSRIRVAFMRAAGIAASLTLPYFRAAWTKDSAVVFDAENIVVQWADGATLSAYVDIYCSEDGDQTNGAMSADLSISYSATVVITGVEVLPSFGGSNGELDEPYAQRIYLANRAISAAGSASYFESIARNVGPEVWDAVAEMNYLGQIILWVYSPPGGDTAASSNAAVVAKVKEEVDKLVYLNAGGINTTSATMVTIDLGIKYWISAETASARCEAATVLAVEEAFAKYSTALKSKLGQSFALAALSAALVDAGAVAVEALYAWLPGVFGFNGLDITESGVEYMGLFENRPLI